MDGGMREVRKGVCWMADVEVLHDAMREGVATKGDILILTAQQEMQALRNEMQSLRKEMISEIQALRSEMQSLRKEMISEIQALRGEMQNFRELLQAQNQLMLWGFSLIGTMILVSTLLEKIL